MDLSMNFCPWTSMVSAVKARGRRGFDKRRFVHGRGRRGFSNAVVVHVHGLRVFAVDPEHSFSSSSNPGNGPKIAKIGTFLAMRTVC